MDQDACFVDYEEGIYVGYRYYETRGYTEYEKSGDHSWYDDAVIFPFGYGLSYSDFTWTLDRLLLDGAEISSGDAITQADKGNGVLAPTGKATRAQTAQMLKNFMENQ